MSRESEKEYALRSRQAQRGGWFYLACIAAGIAIGLALGAWLR